MDISAEDTLAVTASAKGIILHISIYYRLIGSVTGCPNRESNITVAGLWEEINL